MTRDEFFRALSDSRLLSPEHLEQLRAASQADVTGVAAAERSILTGAVTHWQAQQLLAGRTRLYLGRYKLLRALGQGGMGAVYQAEQSNLRRIVAIKVIAPNVLQNADAVNRFLREIRTVAALHHPNVVEAYDADRVGETYFFVMEYVPGADLKTWIRRHRTLPIGWACEVARQTAVGLQHAFEHGLVHRDVKPANILIAQSIDPSAPYGEREIPRVKILDLGLARFTSEKHDDATLTQSGQIMGTPDYIAPEQAENTRLADVRADLYSLGCSLFEMLAGRVPFDGETSMQKILARMRRDAPRVRTFRPDVPPALDEVIARLLARDPAHRPQSPLDAARLLEPFSLTGTASSLPSTVWLAPEVAAAGTLNEGGGDSSLDSFRTVLSDHASETPPDTPFAFATAATPGSGVTPLSARSGSRALIKPSHVPFIGAAVALLIMVGVGALWIDRPASSTTGSDRREAPVSTRNLPTLPNKEPKTRRTDPEGESPRFPIRANDVEVAAEILRKGGQVRVRDSASIETNVTPKMKLPPGQLSLIRIDLDRSSTFYRSDLPKLDRLHHLEWLGIVGISLPRNPFQSISTLPALTSLDLRDVGLGDEGVEALSRFPSLEHLTFGDSLITDDGLRHLSKLERLKSLNLTESRIRGSGFRALTGLPDLATLVIGNYDGFTDLSAIKEMRSLTYLALSQRISDGPLEFLPDATQLRILNISSTATSDDTLKILGRCHNLEQLYISGGQYSSSAVAELRKQLRGCKVDFNGKDE